MAAGEGGDEEVRVLQTLRGKICESLGGVDSPHPLFCVYVRMCVCTSRWPEREGRKEREREVRVRAEVGDEAAEPEGSACALERPH